MSLNLENASDIVNKLSNKRIEMVNEWKLQSKQSYNQLSITVQNLINQHEQKEKEQFNLFIKKVEQLDQKIVNVSYLQINNKEIERDKLNNDNLQSISIAINNSVNDNDISSITSNASSSTKSQSSSNNNNNNNNNQSKINKAIIPLIPSIPSIPSIPPISSIGFDVNTSKSSRNLNIPTNSSLQLPNFPNLNPPLTPSFNSTMTVQTFNQIPSLFATNNNNNNNNNNYMNNIPGMINSLHKWINNNNNNIKLNNLNGLINNNKRDNNNLNANNRGLDLLLQAIEEDSNNKNNKRKRKKARHRHKHHKNHKKSSKKSRKRKLDDYDNDDNDTYSSNRYNKNKKRRKTGLSPEKEIDYNQNDALTGRCSLCNKYKAKDLSNPSWISHLKANHRFHCEYCKLRFCVKKLLKEHQKEEHQT